MARSQKLHITLDLEAGVDPLRGTLESPSTRPRAFWGWMGLIQAIEDAIASRGGKQAAGELQTNPNPAPLEDPHEHQDP